MCGTRKPTHHKSIILGGQGFGNQSLANDPNYHVFPPQPAVVKPQTPFDQYLQSTTIEKAKNLKSSLQLDIFDSLMNPIESNKNRPCDHQWQKYTGFSESYEFCSKCDKKK